MKKKFSLVYPTRTSVHKKKKKISIPILFLCKYHQSHAETAIMLGIWGKERGQDNMSCLPLATKKGSTRLEGTHDKEKETLHFGDFLKEEKGTWRVGLDWGYSKGGEVWEILTHSLTLYLAFFPASVWGCAGVDLGLEDRGAVSSL